MFDLPSDSVVGAALVEDHVFETVAAYKAYLQALRDQKLDFYVLRVGPGHKYRIAVAFDTVPMIETAAKCNVDPLGGVR